MEYVGGLVSIFVIFALGFWLGMQIERRDWVEIAKNQNGMKMHKGEGYIPVTQEYYEGLEQPPNLALVTQPKDFNIGCDKYPGGRCGDGEKEET